MRCAKCGSESPAGKKFCGDCGAELSNCCPSCGAVILASWKFCRGCGAAIDPALSKFVGRLAELAQMNDALKLARSGHGQIVAVVGEAGVGKSRLFHEFKSTSQSGWMVLEAFSVSHRETSAYLPVIDLLKKYFEIAQDDDMGALREKVRAKVLTLDRALEDNISSLFSLLGIAEAQDPLGNFDAQVDKRRMLDAIKQILLSESLNQPLMLIFEDLHWADEETHALLNLLADSISTSKLLLLVSYPPEYLNQWGSKSDYTQLRLAPLGSVAVEEMLSALVGVGEDLSPLKRLIIERTEGNPFFIEETVQMLLDVGALVGNGSFKLTKTLDELSIPLTVENILASRVARLPLDEKELLQTMAVIGREFAFSVLKSIVAKSDDELDRMLADLQMRRFIHERPVTGDIEFAFNHALTQEAAYNSLLVEQRKLLHERIGSAVEASFARTIENHVSELAHHYSRSSNADKAVEYLERAGRQAITRGALKEAEIHFKDAIASLGSTSGTTERMQREFERQLALVEELLSTNGPATGEETQAIERTRELGDKLGTPGQLMPESLTAGKPQEEFKVLEESVPNHPPEQMQSVLPSELDPGQFESVRLRPSRDPNLAAFSAITFLVLISLAILYQGGLLEDVQSLLKARFG